MLESRRTLRIGLATLVGSVAIFLWGAFSHMVLIRGVGYSNLPNEDAIVGAIRASVPEDGLYFFPNPDYTGRAPPDEVTAWEKKFRAGPTGMLVIQTAGDAPVSPRKLLIQFLCEALAAAIGAFFVSMIAKPYAMRVAMFAGLGAFACLSVSTIYWNWYGYPTMFFLAQCVDKIVGWMLVGLVIAKIAPGGVPTRPEIGIPSAAAV